MLVPFGANINMNPVHKAFKVKNAYHSAMTGHELSIQTFSLTPDH